MIVTELKYGIKHRYYRMRLYINRHFKKSYIAFSKYEDRSLKYYYYKRVQKLNMSDCYIMTKINLNYIQYKTASTLTDVNAKLLQNVLKSELQIIGHFADAGEKKVIITIIKKCDTHNSQSVQQCITDMYQQSLTFQAFKPI